MAVFVVGVSACQTKRDASAFDPDERESLSEVARRVGSALHALLKREDQSGNSLIYP